MATDDEWRCGRHLAPPCGVCPHCLRDRLLRLCPDCACPRSCPCARASSSGGALVRVHSLIEREPRVARAQQSGGGGGEDDQARASSKSGRVWGWVSFRKPPAEAGYRDVEEEEEYDDVSVSTAEARGASKASRWGRLIPWKIKALRRRKPSVLQ